MSLINSFNDDIFFNYGLFNRRHTDSFKIDMTESENNFLVKADIPGVNRSDIKLTFNNGVLKIKAERHNEFENSSNGNYISERTYGSISRSIKIPQNINQNGINAKYRDGVLVITLPKLSNDNSATHHINVE
jgi:HSP20 family protein